MRNCDIAIIGGGILGCATAFFLSRKAPGKVVLFERRTLAAQTTSRAAAMFNRSRPYKDERRMVRTTFGLIPELEEITGAPLGYNQVGSLSLAKSDKARAEIGGIVDQCIAEGDDFRYISEKEAMSLTPWLRLDEAHMCAYCPDDGYIDPYRLAMAYAAGARHNGVELHQNVEVTDIRVEKGRAAGLATSEGDWSCGTVIDAAGPWAAILAKRAGVSLPLAPVRSHYWITESVPPYDRPHPVMVMPDAKAYARPEVGSMLLGIRDAHSAYVSPGNLPSDISGFSFDDDFDGWRALEAGFEPVLAYAPSLAEATFKHYVSGPSAYTLDGRFVIGRTAHTENLVVVAGCCGAGIAHSSGFGMSGAALALGEDLPFDIAPYDPDRFGEFDPTTEDFAARCAATRSGKTAA